MPWWDEILLLAARCYEVTQLGYLGADVVLDKDHGPMILELNARPGLAIQTANGQGLHTRLREIESLDRDWKSPQERVAWAQERFGEQQ